MERLSVSEAARRLGVTPDAVRQRIRRGTIDHDRDGDGKYRVYLTPQDARRDGVQDALLDRPKDENEFLRSELQRKDAILLNMTEGLKSLEAPREPRESAKGEAPEGQDEPQEKRSWWHRWFGA